MILDLVTVSLLASLQASADPYQHYELQSRELNDSRHIWVQVPPNYTLNSRRFPLTLVLDGDDRDKLDMVWAASRYTSALDFFDPVMPEQIVVGIESHNRAMDFDRNRSAMLRFIELELIPFLAGKYRVIGPHVIVGHSLAGAFAIHALCSDPAMFRGVVAISPALSDSSDYGTAHECLVKLNSLERPPEHSIYVAWGDGKGDRTEEQFRPYLVRLERELGSIPQKGLHARFSSLAGFTHARTPLPGFPEGLAFVLADPASEPADSVKIAFIKGQLDPLVALRKVTANRARFGAPVDAPPPARWINVAALLLTRANRSAEAEPLLRAGIEQYPERLELYDLLADIYEKRGASTQARDFIQRAIRMAEREDLSPRDRAQEIATRSARLQKLR